MSRLAALTTQKLPYSPPLSGALGAIQAWVAGSLALPRAGMSCLYIFEINSLSVALIAIIFSHSEDCLFTLFIVSFVVQMLLSLIRSHLFICFYFCSSRRWVIEDLAVIYVIECSAYVFL